jgi:2EXR family
MPPTVYFQQYIAPFLTEDGGGDELLSAPWPASHGMGLSTLTIGDQEGRVFTVFPKLSAELRIKIWKWVCFQPRNVDLWEVRVCDKYSPRYPGFIVYKSHTTTPAILHTSQEAREEGLKFYVRAFSTSGLVPDGRTGRWVTKHFPSQIYINPKCDTLLPIPECKSFPILSQHSVPQQL